MGATRRGTYAAAEAATAATGSEARPSQASPSAAAAGGDGASPMGTAGTPMVDNAGDEDEESSDEEEEVVMETARKLECDSAWKNHARVQVTLPAGMQPNVVHINTFCSDENNKLWGEIGYTEVAALPHTATNRFKITDDLVKAYAKIAARANDLGLSKPAEDGGSKVMLMPLVTETLQRQGMVRRRSRRRRRRWRRPPHRRRRHTRLWARRMTPSPSTSTSLSETRAPSRDGWDGDGCLRAARRPLEVLYGFESKIDR